MPDTLFPKRSLWLTCALVAATTSHVFAQARPFPQHVRYAGSSIRPVNFSQAQQDADVRAYYDSWKASYLQEAGSDPDTGKLMFRIAKGEKPPESEQTVSEGQGYGMMIVALMAGHDPDARRLFDGLHRFAKRHPSKTSPALMQWKVPLDPKAASTSAFDGDADIAYGLMLAHAQWGSEGEVNYRQAANELLAALLKHCVGPRSHLPMLGDWVRPDDSKFNQFAARTSDFMPAHFRTWARFSGNPAWSEVAKNCADVVSVIQEKHSPVTGLLPDFIIGANPLSAAKPAEGRFLEGEWDGHYYYNAGRDPWRLALDGLLNGDPGSRVQALKIVSWVKGATREDAGKIKSGYTLAGGDIPGNGYASAFFISPLGVAAMLDATHQTFLDSIYAKVRTSHKSYYEDTVNLLCLLAMSGNYWDPSPAVPLK